MQMGEILAAYFLASGVAAKIGAGVKVNAGKRLGGQVSEADLKIWTEGLL